MSESEEVAVDELTDDQIKAQYECFGAVFDSGDETCVSNCYVRDRCVRKMGIETVPNLMKIHAGTASVDQLAQELDVPISSVNIAMAVAKGKNIEDFLPMSIAKRDELEAQKAEEVVTSTEVEEALEEVAEEFSNDAVEEQTDLVPDPVDKGPDAAEEDLKPAKPKKSKKKATEKKATKKKATQEKVAKKKTTKKATKKATKKKVAKKAESSPPPATGDEFQKAHDRERSRSKLVGLLEPGQKLTREYKGETVTVTVKEGHYLYDGKKYPTLYSVLMEVTGAREFQKQPDEKGKRKAGTRVMSNWSVPRFFRLKEVG